MEVLVRGAAARCCQAVGVTEETVDGRDSALEIDTRSSYVPSLSIEASDPGIPARRRRNCAAHAPGSAQRIVMDEILKARRQQSASSLRAITIRGAREHNLKNVDVEIPRDKLVVFTGLSGSGKSSLAFDTIYAEGQRRYVESLSAYARQFLEM